MIITLNKLFFQTKKTLNKLFYLYVDLCQMDHMRKPYLCDRSCVETIFLSDSLVVKFNTLYVEKWRTHDSNPSSYT